MSLPALERSRIFEAGCKGNVVLLEREICSSALFNHFLDRYYRDYGWVCSVASIPAQCTA